MAIAPGPQMKGPLNPCKIVYTLVGIPAQACMHGSS